MTTKVNGDTGVSQVQDGTIVAADFQAALFAASLTANGYQKLPSGLIIQWGKSGTVLGLDQILWPIQFPNAVFACFLTPILNPTATDLLISANIQTLTTSGVDFYKRFVQGASNPAQSSVEVFAIAIGY